MKKEVKTASHKLSAVSRKSNSDRTFPMTYDLRLTTKFEIFIKKNALLLFTVTELLLLFIVFHKFLLLNDTYLFKDIGSDTIAGFWPNYVHLSEYFRHTGFPGWSFNSGIGKNIYPFSIGNPFTLVLCLLPKDIIPYAIIFAEVLKIYLGGLFFFLFLRNLKITAFTSVIGGLLFSFSGFVIVGSSQYQFTTEALFASMVVYCCEKFLRSGTWCIIPVPFFFIAAYNPFLLYQYGLLCSICCIIIITANEGWQVSASVSKSMKNLLLTLALTLLKIGTLAFSGVIISSFIFLSDIDLLIHSPRGFEGESSVFATMSSVSIFKTAPHETITALYRFFSSDLMGTGNNYKGWGQYYETPTLYTGILTCLLMPQAFFLMGRRKSIAIAIGTILAIMPLIFPFFRYLFWLFSGNYYRTYSLFLSMLFLILCLKTLSAIDSSPSPTSGAKGIINIPVLFITLTVLLILLFYPFYSNFNLVNNNLRFPVAFFLVFYTCLIYFFSSDSYRNHKPIAIGLLGITILTELAYFSYLSVNPRPVVSSIELHEKAGYNDYTIDAVAYINAKDAGFFRIGKGYSSSPSWIEGGYNDGLMQNYKGTSSYDSFNQPWYIHFLNEMNVKSVENVNRKYIAPNRTRPLLSVLLNEKYGLVKQPFPKIPYSYDSVTTIGNVTIVKDKLFLPFGYTYQNYISLAEFRKLNNFQKDKMLFRAFVTDTQDLRTIHESPLRQLYAKDTIPGTSVNLNEFSKYIADLRQDSLSNLVYTQNTVKGTIKISQTKLLFLTIPYDKGWQLKVDGAITKALMPTIGFTGVMLEKGEHSIELNYEPPFLKLGCYISGFSLLGYLFLFIRYRKKRF